MRYSLAATAVALGVCLTGCELFAPELNTEEVDTYYSDISDMLQAVTRPNRKDCRKFKFLLENRHTKTTEAVLRRVAFDVTTGSEEFFLKCKISATERAYFVTTASYEIASFQSDKELLKLNITAISKVSRNFIDPKGSRASKYYKYSYKKRLADLGDETSLYEYISYLEEQERIDEAIEMHRVSAHNGNNLSKLALLEKYNLILLEDGSLSKITDSDLRAASNRSNGIEVINPKQVLAGQHAQFKLQRQLFVVRNAKVKEAPISSAGTIETYNATTFVGVYGETENWVMIAPNDIFGEKWVQKSYTTQKPPEVITNKTDPIQSRDPYIPLGTQRMRFQKCKVNIHQAARTRRVKPVIKIDTSLMYLARVPVAKNNYREYDSVQCFSREGKMTVTRTRI